MKHCRIPGLAGWLRCDDRLHYNCIWLGPNRSIASIHWDDRGGCSIYLLKRRVFLIADKQPAIVR